MKSIVELAVAAGRSLQSPQTGYIHHFYENTNENDHKTIPTLENFLFALALFRTRLVDNVTEAKSLVTKLLEFQNTLNHESKGNFPVYLHSYPECKNPLQGLLLLPPSFWILKQYGHVLGQDLKKKMEKACRDILSYMVNYQQRLQLTYSISVRFAAANYAFGTLWSDHDLINRGEKLLHELQSLGETDYWHDTHYLSDLIISLQMVYPSIKESPWNALWHYLERTWHLKTCTYAGPCIREEQMRGEPNPSFYDLFLGYISGQMSSRAQGLSPFQLQGALIQAVEDKFEVSVPSEYHGKHQDQSWTLAKHHDWACTLLDRPKTIKTAFESTYTPFRFIWGDASKTHSFVCQGTDFLIKNSYKDSEAHLLFHLEGEPNLEDRNKQREIDFYFDYHEGMNIQVNNEYSSTFELGQVVTIESGERKIMLVFELLEGEGEFFGHLMRGNRPSQAGARGENRFISYDWHLFLRTIRRQSKCSVRATFASS